MSPAKFLGLRTTIYLVPDMDAAKILVFQRFWHRSLF